MLSWCQKLYTVVCSKRVGATRWHCCLNLDKNPLHCGHKLKSEGLTRVFHWCVFFFFTLLHPYLLISMETYRPHKVQKSFAHLGCHLHLYTETHTDFWAKKKHTKGETLCMYFCESTEIRSVCVCVPEHWWPSALTVRVCVPVFPAPGGHCPKGQRSSVA